jgi:UDP-glucose 4-epimerase
MKNILVTGAAGFIGSNLISVLANNKKYKLILTDRKGSRDGATKVSESSNQRFNMQYLDITDRESIFRLFKNNKVDMCVHLAAVVNVEDSIKYPDKTMDVNVKGTINILEACANNHVENFVFASSAAVYGHPMKIPITEKHQLNPISPYGVSKLLAEKHVTSYMNSKQIRNTISLRIFNVYGDIQFDNGSVITKFAKRLSLGLPPVIYGTGSQKRDFVSIKDVVNAILLSIKAMEERSDLLESASPLIFNIGTGVATTIKDLCHQMISLSGLDLEPFYKEGSNEADINESCADITKGKKFLNFFPKTNLAKDLERIISSTVTTQIK